MKKINSGSYFITYNILNKTIKTLWSWRDDKQNGHILVNIENLQKYTLIKNESNIPDFLHWSHEYWISKF